MHYDSISKTLPPQIKNCSMEILKHFGSKKKLHSLFCSLCVYMCACMCLYAYSDQASKKHPFPCPTSYRTALSHYVDITSCPRTNVLRELAEHASNPEHKNFLLEITSASEEGKVKSRCLAWLVVAVLAGRPVWEWLVLLSWWHWVEEDEFGIGGMVRHGKEKRKCLNCRESS